MLVKYKNHVVFIQKQVNGPYSRYGEYYEDIFAREVFSRDYYAQTGAYALQWDVVMLLERLRIREVRIIERRGRVYASMLSDWYITQTGREAEKFQIQVLPIRHMHEMKRMDHEVWLRNARQHAAVHEDQISLLPERTAA